MKYETKNKIGKTLELAGLVGLYCSGVFYPDMAHLIKESAMWGSACLFGAGWIMREEALGDARLEGFGEGYWYCRNSQKLISGDLSGEVEDGVDLPWGV